MEKGIYTNRHGLEVSYISEGDTEETFTGKVVNKQKMYPKGFISSMWPKALFTIKTPKKNV